MEASKKKLFSSPENGIIAGVCSGIAEYFDTDPVLVRAIFVLLALLNGIGVILYLALIIMMPEKSGQAGMINQDRIKVLGHEFKMGARSLATSLKHKKWHQDDRNIVGLIVVFIGFVLLLSQVLPISFLRWDLIWPFIIIAVGFYVIFKPEKRQYV